MKSKGIRNGSQLLIACTTTLAFFGLPDSSLDRVGVQIGHAEKLRHAQVHEEDIACANTDTPTREVAKFNAPMACTGQLARKHIRINFHYVLRNDGTGNFGPTDDGFGDTSFTGYDFAQELIDAANDQLNVNEGLWLYSGSTPYVAEDFGFELQLNGVYFHNDSTDYNAMGIFSGGWPSSYAIDSHEAINVIVFEDGTYNQGYCKGIATSIGAGTTPMFKMQNLWTEYRDYGAAQSWCGVRTLVHELGHLLNLYHSWGADACPDTPTHPNCWAYDASDPDCDQWGVEISNNIIDYNQWQGWSLSPCQLDRVHNELDGPLYDHVVQCSECKPASVFFDMEPSQCAPVRLDGTASDNEDRFFVEIYEVANVGDTAPIANLSSSRWYPGQVGVIDDLGAFAGFHFGAGRTYLVKVAVQSDAPGGSNGSCVTWDEQVSYVRIPPSIACPMDTIDIKGSRE